MFEGVEGDVIVVGAESSDFVSLIDIRDAAGSELDIDDVSFGTAIASAATALPHTGAYEVMIAAMDD